MLPTIGGRVRLNGLTVRWWKTGAREYAGELEATPGFLAGGRTLREVVAAIRAHVTSAAVPPDPPQDVQRAEYGMSLFRKETYRRHAIVTASGKRGDAGWVAQVRVYNANGALEGEPLEVTFPTAELADEAALQLGRAWVDRLS